MTCSEIVCISHGEDVDGLTCAGLLKRLKGAFPILVTYDELKDTIKSLKPPLEELYICDLNMREDLVEDLLKINDFANITLIDHHPSSPGLLEKLDSVGMTIIHSTLDCASILLFDHFREELGREAGRIAAFAAWADQFEDGPIAELLLRDYDRQSVQLEGLLLAFALVSQTSMQLRNSVVDEIANLSLPHRIEGVIEAASTHLEDMAKLTDSLRESAIHIGELAYFNALNDIPIGSAAGMITDALGVNVGLCYKKKGDLTNISIRSKRGLNFHLGDITRDIASRNNGFGGGHKRASGASIPSKNLKSFIEDLREELRFRF
jgi:hypothetical protein